MRASFAHLGALGLAAVGSEGFAPPSSGGIARRQVQQQRRHGHVTMFGGPSHRRGASMLRYLSATQGIRSSSMCRLSSVQVSQEGGGDLKVEAAEQAEDVEKKKKKPGPKKKRAPASEVGDGDVIMVVEGAGGVDGKEKQAPKKKRAPAKKKPSGAKAKKKKDEQPEAAAKPITRVNMEDVAIVGQGLEIKPKVEYDGWEFVEDGEEVG